MANRYYISQNQKVIYTKIKIADSFITRFLGLMGKSKLDKGEGLLLLKCSAIHTCFMRFPIDVVYLDSKFQVIGCETLKPWKIGSLVKGSCNILELPAGSGEQLKCGEPVLLSMCKTANMLQERKGKNSNA